MKKCCRCSIIKDFTEFSKNKRKDDGLQPVCKDCANAYYKEYYEKNKNKRNKYVNNYHKERSSKDSLFKMRLALRTRIRDFFKTNGYSKNISTIELLGADWSIVKRHIEDRFVNNMTWDNHGEWHIDHIIPLASAKSEQELISLCHYTNLQPLWAEDNLSKGDKIIACRVDF